MRTNKSSYNEHIKSFKEEGIELFQDKSIHRDEFDFHTYVKIDNINHYIAYCDLSESHYEIFKIGEKFQAWG